MSIFSAGSYLRSEPPFGKIDGGGYTARGLGKSLSVPIRNSLFIRNVSSQYVFIRTQKPHIACVNQAGERIQVGSGRKEGVFYPSAPENHSAARDLHSKGLF